ncbi:hypothetical protein Gpo141_00008489 [Globisporangium polare]
MATALPSTDAISSPVQLSSSSSAPLHLNRVENSATERAYGTFEVSLIDVESEQDGVNDDDAHFHDKSGHEFYECGGGLCYSQDCCFLMAFLCAPIRLRTYKALLFHVANSLFAVVASVWTIALLVVKLVALASGSWRALARRLESRTLRTLLKTDAVLFNFISPVEERVKVYSSPTSSSESVLVFFGLSAKLYYAVVKLVCSTVPGLASAAIFLWTVQRLFVIVLCAFSSSSNSSSCDAVAFGPATVAGEHFLTTPVQDLDLLVLLAVIAVYGATMLMQVSAYISRHATVFFCAEHLRFAAAHLC